MKLLAFDSDFILNSLLAGESSNTEFFEIFFDIARLLEIDITKESLFRLYTKYSDNYGKLRDYICLLRLGVDKQKFNEEFVRRARQIYFIHSDEENTDVSNRIKSILDKYINDYYILLVGAGNIELIKVIISNLDLARYINMMKLTEYKNELRNTYNIAIQEISENFLIEETIISIGEKTSDQFSDLKLENIF